MTIRSPLGRDVALAAVAAISSLALYALTLQPDFGGPEDTPKFQFIGYVLGIPHPPGYPLYVLLSRAFVALPIGTIAYRANLFSAVMAAAACGLSFAIARQLGARRWTAICAALGLATGASFWRSAVFAEVYSLAAVMAGLTIALLLAWGAPRGMRWLVAAFAAFAFGLGNHLTIVGAAPAFAAYALTRGRRVFSTRVVGVSALVLALGLAQYGLIVVRTRQEAPYLETRADSVRALFGVVTAERFADQRFAFSPSVLLMDHLPALTGLIAREFGAVGSVLFLAGVVTGLCRGDPRLVLGAAAGMLVMVMNLSGDLKGFITPLMVLLWPVAGAGADALARAAQSIGGAGRLAGALVLAAAALPPAMNLAGNYAQADQSRQAAQGRFLRGAFRQMPGGAGLVAEDYWADMAWHYYQATGEAGPNRDISRVNFDAASVRQAARDGRRVFAFATAATFLAGEGLRFRRAVINGPALDEWLAWLPRGSLVVGAVANAPFTASLSGIGHPDARPTGRLRAFEVFAVVAGRRGRAWQQADDQTSLRVDAESLASPLPSVAGLLVASSGPGGARIELAGRAVARADTGVVLAILGPDGTLLRALELPSDPSRGVPYAEALYELAGESHCAHVTADRWTDLGAVLAQGSWVATMPDAGSAVIDTLVPAARDVGARSTVLLGDGRMETVSARGPEGEILTSTLTRPADRRPLFRLALDRPVANARARLRAGDGPATVTVCAHHPAVDLFEAGETAALRPDFESEPFYGAGWSDAERTPTGPVRRGAGEATLLLPLEPGRGYRLRLDVASDRPIDLDVTVNDTRAGTCRPHEAEPCEVVLPAAAIRGGVNRVALSSAGAGLERPSSFTLRGARITTLSSPR